MIPETWELLIKREGGGWRAQATKQEGVRGIQVHTWDKPKPSLEAALELLEERIKQ